MSTAADLGDRYERVISLSFLINSIGFSFHSSSSPGTFFRISIKISFIIVGAYC